MARGCRLALPPLSRLLAAPRLCPATPRGAGRGRLNHGPESRPLDWRGTAAVPLDVARRPSTRAHVDSWVDPPATAPSARRRAADTRACGLGGKGRGGGGGGKCAIRRRGDYSCRPPAGGRPRMLPRPEPAEAPVGVPVLSRGVPACRPLPAAQGGQESPAVPLPMRRMIRAPNPDGRVRLCIPRRA